ncbi:MAG: septum formation initiator family protein [Alphaproteobacteria bacterium]|nr:MAG: septum formation initiator family protein [Alphaproteobacteria bacterium]
MRVSEQRQHKSISHYLATFISFGLFFYFAYHLAHGDRGYFAWKGLQKKLTEAEAQYDQKRAERQALENRVKLLRPDSLDLDMLDERARTVLGFVKPNEKVVIEHN